MAEQANTSTTSTPLAATPGAKMLYLIKRNPTTSREELVAHWYANHMPQAIQATHDAKAQGLFHAHRYIVTLYDANEDNEHPWDGMAQLWYDEPLPMPAEPHGATPMDTFQQKVEPYLPWATFEYVIIDGELPVTPLTLNAPFPTTRVVHCTTFLVKAKPGTDYQAFFDHWLTVHVPNVKNVLERIGGIRYVVSHSIEPETAPYAGMAELYFDAPGGGQRYMETVEPDGMERFMDLEGLVILDSNTEMVGIP